MHIANTPLYLRPPVRSKGALNLFGCRGESVPGVPRVDLQVCLGEEWKRILIPASDDKGPRFWFDETYAPYQWNWRQFLGAIKGPPELRASAVVELLIQPIDGMYDHNLAANNRGVYEDTVPVFWDCVLKLANGSVFRLHPRKREGWWTCLDRRVQVRATWLAAGW